VANKTTGARWWRVIKSGGGGRLQSFAMEIPYADIGFFRTNSNKICVIRELDAGNADQRKVSASNHNIIVVM
jgi:hypothetical protein